jgi:hypothetical protein
VWSRHPFRSPCMRLIAPIEAKTSTLVGAETGTKTADAVYSQCPLWVISGHVQCNKVCPLYLRKRHQIRHMKCQLRANTGHSQFQRSGERLAMILTTLNVITISPA